MADKKTVTPEEKKLAAEKHVDGLVQKALVALEEMRKLDQDQVDYIVAKASVAALDAHGELALHAFEETYDRISTGCRAWLSRLENESENGKYKETL